MDPRQGSQSNQRRHRPRPSCTKTHSRPGAVAMFEASRCNPPRGFPVLSRIKPELTQTDNLPLQRFDQFPPALNLWISTRLILVPVSRPLRFLLDSAVRTIGYISSTA